MRYWSEKRKWYIFVAMLSLLIGLSIGRKAGAATSGYKNLKEGKVYTKYDVTGDGVTDKVKVSVTESKKQEYTSVVRIFVNDEKAYAYAASNYLYSEIGLVILEDGNVFFDIYIVVDSEDIAVQELYAYKDGKIKKFFDLGWRYACYANYYGVSITGVSGNTVSTRVFAQFLTTGGFLEFKMDWEYKNGSFQRTKNSYTIKYHKKQKWTVNRKIVVFKNVKQTKVAFILKKGDKVQIDKVRYTDTEIFFHVITKDGREGYIPATIDYPDITYFKEAAYSG